jgi:hypothetical protein
MTDRAKRSHRTHGMSDTVEYRAWQRMKERCCNPNCKQFKHYGGRGVTICDRWVKFENFIHDMGPRPSGMSLDRINVDGNYEPANCRWATQKDQTRNTRRNAFIEFDGQRKTVGEWAECLGLNYMTLYTRIFTNEWPLSIALAPAKANPWDVAKGRVK